MTSERGNDERKPFALVEKFTDTLWAITVCGITIRAGFADPATLEERADKINACLRDVVRKATKKAFKDGFSAGLKKALEAVDLGKRVNQVMGGGKI